MEINPKLPSTIGVNVDLLNLNDSASLGSLAGHEFQHIYDLQQGVSILQSEVNGHNWQLNNKEHFNYDYSSRYMQQVKINKRSYCGKSMSLKGC